VSHIPNLGDVIASPEEDVVSAAEDAGVGVKDAHLQRLEYLIPFDFTMYSDLFAFEIILYQEFL
jgi:hypothetical protein